MFSNCHTGMPSAMTSCTNPCPANSSNCPGVSSGMRIEALTSMTSPRLTGADAPRRGSRGSSRT